MPDRMSCSLPDSVPPPPHSLESGMEFHPPLRMRGSRGGEYNPPGSALSRTSSCDLEKVPSLRTLTTSWRKRGKRESELHCIFFFSCPQSPGNNTQPIISFIKPQYSVKWGTNNAIHDGLHTEFSVFSICY